VLVGLWLMRDGSDGLAAESTDSRPTWTTTTTRTPVTKPPRTTTSTTQPQMPTLPDWADLEISAVQVEAIPKESPITLAPGESLAWIEVSATYANSRATNGSPSKLKEALFVIGSKGKPYPAADVSSGFNSLDAVSVVVDGTRVSGTVYFVVDSNDKKLLPYVNNKRVPVAPTSPEPSPAVDFVDLARRQVPEAVGREAPDRIVERAMEICGAGRNGLKIAPRDYGRYLKGFPGYEFTPAAALAHRYRLTDPPDSHYRQFTLLAIQTWCPDVQPVADSVLAGNVPPHPPPIHN
jgi:hypothetical protein